jgi:hypothetical protein
VHGPGEREHDRSVGDGNPLRQLALLVAGQKSYTQQTKKERRDPSVAYDLCERVDTSYGGPGSWLQHCRPAVSESQPFRPAEQSGGACLLKGSQATFSR